VAGAVLGEKFLNDVVDSNWRESNKGVRCLPHNFLLLFFRAVCRILLCCPPRPRYFTSFSETVQRPRVRSIQVKGSNIFMKAHLKISCSPHGVASFSKQHVESQGRFFACCALVLENHKYFSYVIRARCNSAFEAYCRQGSHCESFWWNDR
jgi:hypothetical protein